MQVHEGIVDHILFEGQRGRYCVISVKTKDESIPAAARSDFDHGDSMIRFTAKGYGIPARRNITLRLEGEWEDNPSYGMQFSIQTWEEIDPVMPEEIVIYLTDILKIFDQPSAVKLVEQYGANTLSVLDENPETILELGGQTDRLGAMMDQYISIRAVKNIYAFLKPYSVTQKAAVKIYDTLGPGCLKTIQEHPFELCRVSGFGFMRVRKFAGQINHVPDDPARIRAGLIEILKRAEKNDGHLYLVPSVLCKEALQLLNKGLQGNELLSPEQVDDGLYKMVECGEAIYGSKKVYLSKNFTVENDGARHLACLIKEKPEKLDIDPVIREVMEELSISLSEEQFEAVKKAMQHCVSIITGSPGTGKTTVLKTIIETFRRQLDRQGKTAEIMLMAPTGRAARRMADSTGISESRTMHSALGLIVNNISHLNSSSSISADLVIIDECSMIDAWLAYELFSRLEPGTTVVFVGDKDQLPSVGAGNVFSSMISSGVIPTTELTRIFRQAEESVIPHNARKINENNVHLDYSSSDFKLFSCKTPYEASEMIVKLYMMIAAQIGTDSVQVLSPLRDRGEASVKELNEKIRAQVNPPDPDKPEFKSGFRIFRLGDKIMQMKNNNTEMISNGEIGSIVEITEDRQVVLEFRDIGACKTVSYGPAEMANIDLAYASTVHKMQGCEVPIVIMPVLYSHSFMLQRNLLYTAVTRAKNQVFLVGEEIVIANGINRNQTARRNTVFAQQLQHYMNTKEEIGQKLKKIS